MSIDHLDVVTTATLRPELLGLTFRSFCNRLLGKIPHCRLIINVDPLPEDDGRLLESTLQVCHDWFPEVLPRCPDRPSFPDAVRWCWSQVKSEYCFHLEDDWLLLKSIDPARVYDYFQESPQLAEVTLNPSRNRPEEPGFALRPSFVRRDFLLSALPLFDSALDPEKQWRRHTSPGGELDIWHFRHYGEIGEGHQVKDMGALWRKMRALDKWGAGDVSWTKRQDLAWRRHFYRLKFSLYVTLWKLL